MTGDITLAGALLTGALSGYTLFAKIRASAAKRLERRIEQRIREKAVFDLPTSVADIERQIEALERRMARLEQFRDDHGPIRD